MGTGFSWSYWTNILSLMQVCQHWTSMIVSEPRLWTSIYIRSDVESLELAYWGLHLSKDLPLYVKFEFPIDLNTQKTFSQKDTSRIQHLHFGPSLGYFSERDYIDNEQLVKVSANVLRDLGPLPSLYSLTVDMYSTAYDSHWSQILANLDAPQVKYVDSAVFPQDLLKTSRYTQMRYLGISSALETVLPQLVKFSDLKQLSLLARPYSLLAESISRSESSIRAYKNIAPLESLKYFQAHSDFIWPLLRQMGSSLRVLELEIGCENLPKLFTIIRDTHYLHDLSLYILLSSTRGGLNADQWKAPALPQIQRFVLEMKSVDAPILYNSSFTDAAHPVLEAIDNSLPRVRTLHLMSDLYVNDLVRLVQTMETLTSLDVSCAVWNKANGADKATCPALKTLRTKYEDVMYYLIMPNLTSITVTGGGATGMVKNNIIDRSFASTVQSISLHSIEPSPILSDGSEFTQLRTLEWYSSRYGYPYRDGSFPCLTKIIFRDARYGINAFCESLLRYPRLCPCLETICSGAYPEWDILLYMLLRRNIYHGQNDSSRIKRIEIARFPAPCILVPLRDLLLGKIPLRMPSPEELSFVAIEDIYLDPTMYVNFIFTDLY
jgi:hypothetical protein